MPFHRTRRWLFSFLLAVTASASAQVAPGEYAQQAGGGGLSIKAAVRDGLPFSITTLGGNWHICNIEGTIRGRQAVVTDEGERCELRFTPAGTGIKVESHGEGCRAYCGVNAYLDGDYHSLPVQCVTAARDARRKRFLSLYRSKQYREARDTLAPLLPACGKFLHHTEDADVRNDLAIAQYHAGEAAACLATLAPLQRYAAMTDAQVRDNVMPAEADTMARIARAARTNIKLCKAKGG